MKKFWSRRRWSSSKAQTLFAQIAKIVNDQDQSMKSIAIILICMPLTNALIKVPPKTLAIARCPDNLRNLNLNAGDEDDDGWGELKELQQASRQPSVVEEDRERDMFIPIFAVVSLAGLFGAYGYETLRLASREELYLPWNNN